MTDPWAAFVVGRNDEPLHVGPTREDVVVYGGCRWEPIPEDEREDDGPSHWLVGWDTKEIVEADEDEPTDETHFYGVDP
jgi:hypothetical protein